jgi:hypothetical protein
MNQKAPIPGTFASTEEFDEARKNLAMYLATLKGWAGNGKVWLVLKGDGKNDFSQPSAN